MSFEYIHRLHLNIGSLRRTSVFPTEIVLCPGPGSITREIQMKATETLKTGTAIAKAISKDFVTFKGHNNQLEFL